MIAKLIPVVMMLAGLGAGVGAGVLMRPAPADAEGEAATDTAAETAEESETPPEFVKLNNQFVVPVVEGGSIAAMVILSLTLEVEAGSSAAVFQIEPKLRDVFLQVLFDHANAGGFRGSFTDAANLVILRRALHEAAAAVVGPPLKDVLITDIVRQDS